MTEVGGARDGIARQKRIQAAYRNLFNSPEGEIVLRDMMKAAGFTRSNYVNGSFDATAYNEGARAFVLRIVRMMHLTDEQLVSMLLAPETDL